MRFLKEKFKSDKHYKQAVYLLVYIFLSCLLVLWLRPVYLLSIFIVLVPPTVINFLWLKKSRFKIFIFSLFSALIFAPPIELASRLANVWDVQSIFYRPFGLIPQENMLFAFINFLWGLSFYEYFIDKDRSKKISKNLKYLVVLYCILAGIVYSLFYYNRQLVTVNYFMMSVPILILPSIFIFYNHPKLLPKVVLPTIFFAIVFFVYELVSLKIGSWWWPGEYLVSFKIDGKIFPLDDIVIWYFLSTPALIGGYEFFADDDQ